MKGKIIFLCLFSVFLILIMPMISSVNIQCIKTTITNKINDQDLETLNNNFLLYFKSNAVMNYNSLTINWEKIFSRIMGLIIVIEYLAIYLNIRSFKHFLSLEVFMACWFGCLSLIFNKMNNEIVNIIELFQRAIIGFFIGLMSPIFAISYGLNNFLFGEPVGPITKLFIDLWYYAMGTDNPNTDLASPS